MKKFEKCPDIFILWKCFAKNRIDKESGLKTNTLFKKANVDLIHYFFHPIFVTVSNDIKHVRWMSPQAPANRKQTYGEKFLVTSMFQVNVYCNYSEH